MATSYSKDRRRHNPTVRLSRRQGIPRSRCFGSRCGRTLCPLKECPFLSENFQCGYAKKSHVLNSTEAVSFGVAFVLATTRRYGEWIPQISKARWQELGRRS